MPIVLHTSSGLTPFGARGGQEEIKDNGLVDWRWHTGIYLKEQSDDGVAKGRNEFLTHLLGSQREILACIFDQVVDGNVVHEGHLVQEAHNNIATDASDSAAQVASLVLVCKSCCFITSHTSSFRRGLGQRRSGHRQENKCTEEEVVATSHIMQVAFGSSCTRVSGQWNKVLLLAKY